MDDTTQTSTTGGTQASGHPPEWAAPAAAWTEPSPPADPVRRRVSVGHLVMGLVFLGLSLTWALREWDLVEGDQLRWAAPLMFVLAGSVGLALSLGGGSLFRRR